MAAYLKGHDLIHCPYNICFGVPYNQSSYFWLDFNLFCVFFLYMVKIESSKSLLWRKSKSIMRINRLVKHKTNKLNNDLHFKLHWRPFWENSFLKLPPWLILFLNITLYSSKENEILFEAKAFRIFLVSDRKVEDPQTEELEGPWTMFAPALYPKVCYLTL